MKCLIEPTSMYPIVLMVTQIGVTFCRACGQTLLTLLQYKVGKSSLWWLIAKYVEWWPVVNYFPQMLELIILIRQLSALLFTCSISGRSAKQCL